MSCTENFALDTETSGFEGIPSYHANNALIELCCIHLATGERFSSYCIPDFPVPPQATKFNGITNDTLATLGLKRDVLIRKFVDWIKAHTREGLVPMMIGHNIEFDREILLKAMHGIVPTGRNGEKLGWVWYCTMKEMKHRYPDLKDITSKYGKRPYALENCARFKMPGFAGKYHSASTDAEIAGTLFSVLNKEQEMSTASPHWLVTTPALLTYRELTEEGDVKPPILTLMRTIRGFKEYRVSFS